MTKPKVRRSTPYAKVCAFDDNPHRRVRLYNYSANDEALMILQMTAAFHSCSRGMAMERMIVSHRVRCAFAKCEDFPKITLERMKFPKLFLHPDHLSYVKSLTQRYALPSVSYTLNYIILDHHSRHGYELNPILNLLCIPY